MNNKKTYILHIIDDHKFIPYAKATFEIDGLENVFEEFDKININEIDKYDLIIIHFLRSKYISLFSINQTINSKIIWILWGADAFQLGMFFNKHVMFKTWKARIINAFSKNLRFGLSISLRSFFPKLLDFQSIFQNQIECISKIENIWTLVPGDYLGLEKYNPKSVNINHFNYLDPIFISSEKPKFNNGNNILIGNSSEYTNNYQDVIKSLKIGEINDSKLIFPLNYGDEANSKDVSVKAKTKFGSNALCIKEFMPIDDYVNLLNSCEIAIMGHIRQQALGNTVKLLLGGCHVYFNNQSNVYTFLKSKGFIVSDFFNRSKLRKLNDSEKLINKELTETYFGKDRVHSNVLRLIKKTF